MRHFSEPPIIGLSSDRLSVIERIKLGLSQYAHFLKGKFSFIHRSEENFFLNDSLSSESIKKEVISKNSPLISSLSPFSI